MKRCQSVLSSTSSIQGRSSIVGNSVSSVDAQKIFKSTFDELINEHCSINVDTGRYQSVLPKADFSIGTGIYMFPSNLNLNIGITVGYKNKILISNIDMKIGTVTITNFDHLRFQQKHMLPLKFCL